MIKNNYSVLGIMSGTSLDGVDLAICEFNLNDRWTFKLIKGKTIPYSDAWKEKLKNAMSLAPEKLQELDKEYGKYLGELSSNFLKEENRSVDFISSHGHTIHHQPKLGITVQIGSGQEIKNVSDTPVVFNFRQGDVALGGQGAPLVPIGDRLLFSEMSYCLNLGGIANISYENNGDRIAFDICAVNIVLNQLANEKGLEYDKDGELAYSGKLNKELLAELNEIEFYKKPFPKSLGREDIDRDVFPIIKKFEIPVEDKLRTFCEHIAIQIAKVTGEEMSRSRMLVTGGGTLNHFLLTKIEDKCNLTIVVPSKAIVDFKEAIIFAFLGVLRMRNEVNCLSSVTGASRDSSGGDVVK